MRGARSSLLPPLLALSLLIHMILYGALAELYSDDQLNVIELSVEELVRKPAAREIPRPRFKAKLTPLPRDIVRQSAEPKFVEAIRPPTLEPADSTLPENVTATVDGPGSVSLPSPVKADFSAQPSPGRGDGYGSAREYYDMVRLKIESKKKYPPQAKAMRREGRVTVGFVIQAGGAISDLAVTASSGNTHLDRAALKAVSDSSPLPIPPRRFFPGDQAVELTIVFELL